MAKLADAADLKSHITLADIHHLIAIKQLIDIISIPDILTHVFHTFGFLKREPNRGWRFSFFPFTSCPWSAEAESFLDLVRRHGHDYSSLKREDEVQGLRNGCSGYRSGGIATRRSASITLSCQSWPKRVNGELSRGLSTADKLIFMNIGVSDSLGVPQELLVPGPHKPPNLRAVSPSENPVDT